MKMESLCRPVGCRQWLLCNSFSTGSCLPDPLLPEQRGVYRGKELNSHSGMQRWGKALHTLNCIISCFPYVIILTLCLYINRYLFLAQPSSQKTILKLLPNNFLTSNLSSFDIMMIVHASAMRAEQGYLSRIRAAECPAWETSYSNTNTSLSRRIAPGDAQNT